jgi:hypothetical protein
MLTISPTFEGEGEEETLTLTLTPSIIKKNW